MDVVTKNVNNVGGLVLIDSIAGKGTTISLKIPLTLSIIDGMTISVGAVRYTVPITTIRESFKPQAKDIICDPDRNEMIMVRGQCYPILRIHRLFKVTTDITDFTDGIMIMVENEDDVLWSVCRWNCWANSKLSSKRYRRISRAFARKKG